MKNTNYYINGLGVLSPQKTYDNNEFLPQITSYHTNMLHCIAPDFKQYINPIQLRRLSRMLRVGLTAAIICIKDSGNVKPDGIITATGYGFLNDTAKFVDEMLQQQEKHITPTHFMQGTYNALSGLVALTVKCNGYNNTYVSKGFSFETSLQDAMMQLNDDEASSFLVGAYDEADEVQYKVNTRVGHYKTEAIDSTKLFEHPGKGSIQGEGAAFFYLAKEKSDSSWCVLRSVRMVYKPETAEELSSELKNFLAAQNITPKDIDILVNGVSGDADNDRLLNELAFSLFSHIPELRFKHLCGEYCTATAFASWLAASVLKKQTIPQGVQFNSVNAGQITNALVINQYMGRNYSLILLARA